MTTTAHPPTTPTASPAAPSGARPTTPRRRWSSTTPGRLRVLSIVGVAAIVLLLVVGAGALSSRRSAARSVAVESGPDVAAINELYRVFADADAVASSAILRAGLEPTANLRRYSADIEKAARLLTAIVARSDLSPRARRAAETIAQQLPAYTGNVESARANLRFGYPLGAEYMRSASGIMQDDILPATTALYAAAADRLGDDYDQGTSGAQLAWIVVIGALTLVVLGVTLVYTARRTNRIVNVGVAVAAVIVAVLTIWSIARFTAEQDALTTAQRDGSDAVEMQSSARILALRAQAAANFGLAERGTGAAYLTEYDRLMRRLGDDDCRGGILADARTIADRTNDEARVDEISDRCAEYVAIQSRVRELDDAGRFADAVLLALGDGTAAAERLDARIADEIGRAEDRFDDAAADARVGFGVLAVALVGGLLVAGVLVLAGLQRRIGEYR